DDPALSGGEIRARSVLVGRSGRTVARRALDGLVAGEFAGRFPDGGVLGFLPDPRGAAEYARGERLRPERACAPGAKEGLAGVVYVAGTKGSNPISSSGESISVSWRWDARPRWVGALPRKSGSHRTPRWRKTDSNSRSPSRASWLISPTIVSHLPRMRPRPPLSEMRH